MKEWFVCKIKYQKQDEKGSVKNVNEPYLVDAMSYTEAEARIYEELSKLIQGEFIVSNISKSNISDVFFYDDADIWHKCKITYSVADDESGKEKKITNYMLVSAANVQEAYDRIHQSLNNMLVTFRVPSIIESPIVEIFPYVSEADREPEIPENLKSMDEMEDQE
ncbi:DUF4494 domain-containing protein [Fulvivirgaceae bacterium BMA10]|uniref:DUF4494 domain-containing protein n=1 Tax=Splendidivirga corallicola TaxID=3051826 RepID=A0ABT8KGR9_9BACT|nr:DUF4494 domain-containing protein [Fulvivirgaceae bacterium BMA10]